MEDLAEYLKKKGFTISLEGNVEKVDMDGYVFYVEDDTVMLPIPLPTGKESLDDLIAMGVKYARASRMVQLLGKPVTYELKGSEVIVYKKFNNRKSLEEALINALEGIEGLRYFL